jgi:hypothetical protein
VQAGDGSGKKPFLRTEFAKETKKMAVDMDKLNAFLGRFVGDLGAGAHRNGGDR